MTDKVWILVAESSQATIYATNSSADQLVQVQQLEHADSRRHARDITADLPGRNVGGDGSHHALEARTDIKEEESILFAHQINKYLQDGRGQRKFSKLVLMAAPAFLGCLRKHMDEQVAKMVVYELSKNIAQDDPGQIREHLPSRL